MSYFSLQSYCTKPKHASGEDAFREKRGRKLADGGFVYYKRVSSTSFLVSSQSLNNNIISWFAIALDKIRTRRILREKADCKQSTFSYILLLLG